MNFAPETFHLLIAPPAWGKTRLLAEWLAQSKFEFLYISPLRALADEVKTQWPELWVALPEELAFIDWEGLALAHPHLVVIWDEVHLVKEWGESFRPLMIEAWMGFCLSGLRGVGLSATINSEVLDYLKNMLTHSHTHLVLGDAGNMQFKFAPLRWRIGSQNLLLCAAQYTEGRTLIFCSTRKQVDQLVHHFSNEFRVWGCKGGETLAFSERMISESPPEMIVATSCLSHGVNLPALARVVVLSNKTPDWLAHQMFTRAGRRGEGFEVWSLWRVNPLNFVQRFIALLSLLALVMIKGSQSNLTLWWYGNRRYRGSNYSAKRA